MERIQELLQSEHGVLARRNHRTIANQLDYCRRRGLLHTALPGIYTAPDPDWPTRVRAASMFRPGCVVGAAAAARSLWWPECPIATVNVAVQHQVKGTYPGFTFEERRIPLDLVVDRAGTRFAGPALSILDLIPTLGGAVIDEGLRRGAVTLSQLWQAVRLTRERPGNALRRDLLHDSRDKPWSEAERAAHRLLRSAGLTGWRTNFPITINGVTFVVDIAFPVHRIVVEIDGWQYHSSRNAFHSDRWRYARLAAAGWTVLPIPAGDVTTEPDAFVEVVRAALTRCS